MFISISALFCLSAAEVVYGQCNGTRLQLTERSGKILSPNNPYGYGVKSNCSWRATLPRPNTAVLLTIEAMRLHIRCKGKKILSNSYNLTINNVKLDSERLVYNISSYPPFCLAYYNTASCRELRQLISCEKQKLIDSSIDIKYVSDGRRIDEKERQIRFHIKYQYLACQEDKSDKNKPLNLNMIVALALSGVICLLIIIAGFYRWKIKKKRDNSDDQQEGNLPNEDECIAKNNILYQARASTEHMINDEHHITTTFNANDHKYEIVTFNAGDKQEITVHHHKETVENILYASKE